METQTDEAKPPPSSASASPVSNEQALLAFLRGRDAECPACKYNLRDLTSPVCPECGTALVLGVRQADPFLLAWVIATVSMSLVGGVGVLFILLCIAKMRIPADLLDFPNAIAFLGSIAAAPLAVLLVIFRRFFLTRPRRLQWIAATAIVALSIAVFSIFFFFLQ